MVQRSWGFGILVAMLCFLFAAPAVMAEDKDKDAVKTVKGKILSIDAANSTFKLKDADNKTWELTMSKTANVSLDGERSKFAALKQEDEVTVTYITKDSNYICNKIEARRQKDKN